MKWLLLALVSMFIQQSFVTLGKVLPAVLAPVIFFELPIDPSWLGVYVGMIAGSSLIVQAGCGSVIARHGPLRVSQSALLLTGFGLALASIGILPLLALSAISIGFAGSSTPASSHLLGRYSHSKQAPLIFSIKQTAVPVGLLLAGALGPTLTELFGWRFALLIIGMCCVIFALIIEPLRYEFDKDKDEARRFQLSDFKSTITLVCSKSDVRHLALGCFAFVGLQTTFVAYFVLYLTKIGYSLVEAGGIFSVSISAAIIGRIFWGWLSSSYVEPQKMLGFLAIAMFLTTGLACLFNETWNPSHIILVASGISASVFSWHGVLLAEVARLSPASMQGTMTGGVLSFGQLGGLALPFLYSAVLGISGSYQIGFLLCSLPALFVGGMLLNTSLRSPK